MTHNTEVEEKIRIALGELGATWEDPELVVQNVLEIVHHQLQKAREEEREYVSMFLQEHGERPDSYEEYRKAIERSKLDQDPVHAFFAAPDKVKQPVYERALEKAQEDQDKGMPHPFANPEGVYGRADQDKK